MPNAVKTRVTSPEDSDASVAVFQISRNIELFSLFGFLTLFRVPIVDCNQTIKQT